MLEGNQIFSPSDAIYSFSLLLKDGTVVARLNGRTYSESYGIVSKPSQNHSFDVINDIFAEISYPFETELSLNDGAGKEYRQRWQVGLDKNDLMVVRFKYNGSGQVEGEKERRSIVMSNMLVLQRASTKD